MTGSDVLLAALAIGVAAMLARGSHPVIAVLLVASALAVSALLFLPTELLRNLAGMEYVDHFDHLARSTPLDLAEWVHIIVFAWLGLLIWLGRATMRSWVGLALIAALGVAAELAQWLADGREPGLEDAALNVAGGLLGVLFGIWLRRLFKRR